jgi:hypothetical protein
MINPNLCFDAWAVRQLTSDDFGQDHWDNDDSVDYHQVDEDPDGNEENNRAIEQFENEHDLVKDAKNFAEHMLGLFISLGM